MRSDHPYLDAWNRVQPLSDQIGLPFGQMRQRQRGGALKSASAGGSTEFYDHRQYYPGDDIRHINWAATARSEIVTLKQFQQESSPTVSLYLDGSQSMLYDTQKWARTLDLLAFCGLSVARGDIRAHAYACRGAQHVPIALTQPQEERWIDQMQEHQEHEFAPPATTGMPVLRIFISDLLMEQDPTDWVRRHCRPQDRNLFFVPNCIAETKPPWEQQSQLIDPETQQKQDYKIDDGFWKNYHQSYTRHFLLWREALSTHNGLLAQVPADLPLYEALMVDAIPSGLVV